MIQISDHAEGCILPVRAQPGARRNALVGEQRGSLKIAVTAPPDQGRANKAIAEILCDHLNLKRSQVELIAGPTSREKKFLLRGVKPSALMQRLSVIIEQSNDE
jgi:uncharacterized protein (TIGR00251 family)